MQTGIVKRRMDGRGFASDLRRQKLHAVEVKIIHECDLLKVIARDKLYDAVLDS
jgi:hypothetical protein